ncbi:MAG: hypothetical protein ABSA97_13060 [Verrucomicrobiia bacterium]
MALQSISAASNRRGSLRAAPIPVYVIDFSDATDKARHDEMVRLVEEMLAAKKETAKALMDTDKDFWTNKCADLDRQIDKLVYDLYGLTEDEIKIVEQ